VVTIFSDISFDPKSRVGVAGLLLVEDSQLNEFNEHLNVLMAWYQSTTCTQLEINSVIAAMEIIATKQLGSVPIYTDCKSVIDLPGRRERLERASYISKSTGKEHKHANLYREFYKIFDQARPVLIWIKGHKATGSHNVVDSYFCHVDKACRNVLRAHIGGGI
jgi:ribonuclease HI